MGADDVVAWFRALPLRGPAWCRYATWRSGRRLRLTVLGPQGAPTAPPPCAGAQWRRYADPYRNGRYTWGCELVVAADVGPLIAGA